MGNEHIVKSFDRDRSRIESLLLEMGGLVEAQISDAIVALLRRDTSLGARVRESDKRVDALENEINEMTVRFLALRQPVAEDLRCIIAALKVSANLERIGDHAKNIAKRTVVLAQVEPIGSSAQTIRRMSELVQEMIREVLNSFITRDIQTADSTRLRDQEVDEMHNSLFRELLTYMMEDPCNITPCMHLLFVAKNVERMGDHATGIAEQVHYLVSGEIPDDERPKSDATSSMFINPEDAKPRK